MEKREDSELTNPAYEATKRWRKKNREAYNRYQRELMRERRAGGKREEAPQ